MQEERIWQIQRRATKRVGGNLRDKLVQPPHFTLGETEAQTGEAIIQEPFQLPAGLVFGFRAHLFSQLGR